MVRGPRARNGVGKGSPPYRSHRRRAWRIGFAVIGWRWRHRRDGAGFPLPQDGCAADCRLRYRARCTAAVSYTHLRAHETGRNIVCRLLLEKKKKNNKKKK